MVNTISRNIEYRNPTSNWSQITPQLVPNPNFSLFAPSPLQLPGRCKCTTSTRPVELPSKRPRVCSERSLPHLSTYFRRKFRSQTSDIWRDAATVVGKEREQEERRSKCASPPLWREAHFEVKMLKTPHAQSLLQKSTRLWHDAHVEAKILKSPHCRSTFGN